MFQFETADFVRKYLYKTLCYGSYTLVQSLDFILEIEDHLQKDVDIFMALIPLQPKMIGETRTNIYHHAFWDMNVHHRNGLKSQLFYFLYKMHGGNGESDDAFCLELFSLLLKTACKEENRLKYSDPKYAMEGQTLEECLNLVLEELRRISA